MKIKSLKQVLHWLFLVIGVFSMFMLSYSMVSYVNYAQSGYGLDASISEVWLYKDGFNGTWLVIKLSIKNPGGLDMELEEGNVTLGQAYAIPHTILPNRQTQNTPLDEIPKGETIATILWVPIDSDDANNILNAGQADIALDLLIFIPSRYARTHLNLQATAVEVKP